MNIRTGLTSVLRQKTIAWDRFRDLHDLFRNNGSLHDPFGNIVLQGDILLMYDRGLYFGSFRTFEWEDTDESPFAFSLNWTFKVERTVMAINPFGFEYVTQAPAFQQVNTPEAQTQAQAQQASDVQTVNAGQQAAEDAAASEAAPDVVSGAG